jgi:hypothetical protein
MMVKVALAGEGGSARLPPFTISTITYKVAVYAPDERADTLPLFLHYPLYSVVYVHHPIHSHYRCRNRDYTPFSQWSNDKKECHSLFIIANLLLASIGKTSAFLTERKGPWIKINLKIPSHS